MYKMMNTKFSQAKCNFASAERWLKLNLFENQKIASSTVIITTDDCKILDPWIENGEYFGSWSIVEKLTRKIL